MNDKIIRQQENKLSYLEWWGSIFTSSSDDKSIAWQQQQIKLTANAENNRLILPFQALMGLYEIITDGEDISLKSAVVNINKHISDSDATKMPRW